jgi:hypothetical protein
VYLVHGGGDHLLVLLGETPTDERVRLRYDTTRHLFVGPAHQYFDVYGTPVDAPPGARPLFACPVVGRGDSIHIVARSPTLASIRLACIGGIEEGAEGR